MPSLICPNGHASHFRNVRGSRGSGTPCPAFGCDGIRVTPSSLLCNAAGTYQRPLWSDPTESVTYNGRCSEPKGHDGDHARRADRLEVGV